MRLRGVFFTLLIVLLPAVAAEKEIKLEPVDEGAKNPSFREFRDKLIQAAKKHDKEFILNILDPLILNNFGGEGGVREFREQWEMGKPVCKLWDILFTVLSLGGTFISVEGKKEFWTPYVYSKFPPDLDAYDYSVIIGKNVIVRKSPDSAAPPITTLSYHIVRVAKTLHDDSDKPVWVKVVTPSGEKGYVSAKEIRSPLDYRAGFRQVDGKWVMIALVCGD